MTVFLRFRLYLLPSTLLPAVVCVRGAVIVWLILTWYQTGCLGPPLILITLRDWTGFIEQYLCLHESIEQPRHDNIWHQSTFSRWWISILVYTLLITTPLEYLMIGLAMAYNRVEQCRWICRMQKVFLAKRWIGTFLKDLIIIISLQNICISLRILINYIWACKPAGIFGFLWSLFWKG